MMPTRTLLHVYATFGIGGPQMRFVQIANHFGGWYRHLIVAMDGVIEASALLARELNARLIDVPIHRGRTGLNVRTFRGVMAELRPDLLVTSNWGSIEWAIANFDGRVRHLHMEDGFGPDEANRQIQRRVWMRRLVLRRSTVLLPSKTLYRIARDEWRIPERGLVYIPNGIDCDRFAVGPDTAFATAKGIGFDAPVVGTVTGLRKEKNLGRLLDAFARVARRSPARLVIVGDGPERAALRAHAAELGLSDKVVLTGACPSPERLLPSFTVFALSSDTEQMPLSVLEAMAAGRPLAATDVGDIRSMVHAQNHPFVVDKDPDRLAQAIVTLLDEPTRAAAVGAANASRARKLFDQKVMFGAYRKLFDGERLPRANTLGV
jgi:glycosyltransferase involved in cell wall biosynthesis